MNISVRIRPRLAEDAPSRSRSLTDEHPMLRGSSPSESIDSRKRCQLFPLGPNRAVVLAEAKSFIEIPEKVVIGSLEPTILNWAYRQTSVGARLLLFLEKKKRSAEWPSGSERILIDPGVTNAEVTSLDLSELSPPDVVPTLLNLILTYPPSGFGASDWQSDITALMRRLDINLLTNATVRGWLVSLDDASFTFRTFVEQNSLPTGFLIRSRGELHFASPLDMKITDVDMHGVCFAEIRAHVSDGDMKKPSRIDSLHMSSGKRLTHVIFGTR